MNCITCNRPVAAHPRYFAQSRSEPPAADDVQGHYDDLLRVLEHTAALFQALTTLTGQQGHTQLTEALGHLGLLGRDLCEEAERRAKRLLEAGERWRRCIADGLQPQPDKEEV
ncbi:MAG: hypothetical protein AB1671_23680 [Thermodesulfobacteriota bacterium]